MTIAEFIRASAESLERRQSALRFLEQGRALLKDAQDAAEEPARSRIQRICFEIDAVALDLMMDAKLSQCGE